jgi:para-nitrobenzyl esterase
MAGPQVSTKYGIVEGKEEKELNVFKGIPYAKPPIGELRWCAPQASESWAGTKSCAEFSAVCAQESFPEVIDMKLMDVPGPQSEDCLYLNVWSHPSESEKRPVMFWIHGGGLGFGAASQPIYDGQHLARKGVVVVTINYRMGALGFLHLDTVTEGAIPATGNEGFLDQIAALEWVRDNIAGFGGDPDNVTIFGESSGGWSVTVLMAMPKAKGLFHKAIAQSGVANAALPLEHAADLGKEFLSDVATDPTDADSLRAIPADKVLSAGSSFVRSVEALLSGVGEGNRYHRAVIDGDTLPASVLGSIAEGSSSDVVLMAGTTRDEMAAPVPPGATPEELQAIVSQAAYGIDSKEMIERYRESRMKRMARMGDADIASAISTDATMRIPCIRLLEAQQRHQPSYHYIVTWTTPAGDGAAGAEHGIELGFVFGTHGIDQDHAITFGDGPAAAGLANAVMDAWTNFAKTGDPSSDTLGAWPAYVENRATMMIGEQTYVREAPYEEERVAWDGYDNSVLERPPFEPKN